MEDGEHMCQDVMAQEEEINSDPNRKKLLYEKQYREEEERNQESIDDYCREGNICADNPLYKRMLDYETRDEFINDNFHGPSTSQFARYVIVDSTLKSLQTDITPLEKRLLGFDFEKVLRVRRAIENLDTLLEVKKSGQFESLAIVQFIRWCDILPSTKSHHDNEHDFYEKYLKPGYNGHHTWPAWNTVFTNRKAVGYDELQRRLDAASFERKYKEVCGVEKSE
jgi:hypothetical protein